MVPYTNPSRDTDMDQDIRRAWDSLGLMELKEAGPAISDGTASASTSEWGSGDCSSSLVTGGVGRGAAAAKCRGWGGGECM